MNKLLSDVLFPKHNASKIKKDIIESTCSACFINTIKKIILSSDAVSKKGIGSFGIFDFQNLQIHEIIDQQTEDTKVGVVVTYVECLTVLGIHAGVFNEVVLVE